VARCNCLNHPTLDLDELHDTCHCGDPSWPTIASLHFDKTHRLALDLTRCAAGGFATNDLRLWDFGLSAAMNKLGPVEGAKLFAGVLATIKTIRVERTGQFNFLTVRCSRITHDECDLMTCLIHARLKSESALAESVKGLVGSHECVGTLEAINALGAFCSQIGALDQGPAPSTSTVTHAQRTLH